MQPILLISIVNERYDVVTSKNAIKIHIIDTECLSFRVPQCTNLWDQCFCKAPLRIDQCQSTRNERGLRG